MFLSTLNRIVCVHCSSHLTLKNEKFGTNKEDVFSGTLHCSSCEQKYPILNGVALLVADVADYILSHAKGISLLVPISEIPEEIRELYLEILSEIEPEHIEEDLEAARVNALYLMTHFLNANEAKKIATQTESGGSAPLLKLISDYWDHGPFEKITEWVKSYASSENSRYEVLELGCGVGGLSLKLAPYMSQYLGIDSAFASIALARHFILGAEYPSKEAILLPADLFQGALTASWPAPLPFQGNTKIDFVVADLLLPPVQEASIDLCLALNAIDMLNDPSALPQVQRRVLRESGRAIQSGPYIWHPSASEQLRIELPQAKGSASAIRRLYEKSGFLIEQETDDVPWLFFKHSRQIELYSVHILSATIPPSLL